MTKIGRLQKRLTDRATNVREEYKRIADMMRDFAQRIEEHGGMADEDLRPDWAVNEMENVSRNLNLGTMVRISMEYAVTKEQLAAAIAAGTERDPINPDNLVDYPSWINEHPDDERDRIRADIDGGMSMADVEKKYRAAE